MPTYQKITNTADGAEVLKLHKALLATVPEFERLAGVRVDYVWAFCDRDEDGQPKNDALRLRGKRAYGICRIIGLKDRAKGMGDAEILLDADYWKGIGEKERAALVDHELTHIQPKTDRTGKNVLADDLGRPKLGMRKHDVEIGWFCSVAKRHGIHSIEQQQAREILDSHGQFFWPQISGAGALPPLKRLKDAALKQKVNVPEAAETEKE